MEDATVRFARAARDADVALFYYSGPRSNPTCRF
jgi:uncharacterized caspase-like protein